MPSYWALLTGMFGLLTYAQLAALASVPGYALQEWLISFPGHFVRRGVRGTVVIWASHAIGVGPYQIASVLGFALYGVMIVVAVTLIFRWLLVRAPTFIPMLLLSPAGFFFYVNSPGAANRLDPLFILVTAAHVELYARSKDARSYLRWAGILFASAGTLAMLGSEVFLFIGLPINLILAVRRLSRFDPRLLLVFAGPLLAAALCFIYHGTPNDAVAISRISSLGLQPYGPLWFLSRPPSFAPGFVLDTMRAKGGVVLTTAAIVFLAAHLGIMRTLLKHAEPTALSEPPRTPIHVWRDLFVLPFVCSLPLYFVAIDFTRWAVLAVTMFTLSACRLNTLSKPVKPWPPVSRVLAAVIFASLTLPECLIYPGSLLYSSNVASVAKLLLHRGYARR